MSITERQVRAYLNGMRARASEEMAKNTGRVWFAEAHRLPCELLQLSQMVWPAEVEVSHD